MSLQLLRGARPESRADAVARRFRGAVAELSMTKAEVARRLSKPETWVGRRASGSTAFTLDDLDQIEAVIGISANYLFTGVNEENRHPDNPNGGSRSVVHPPGLEPGTHWLTVGQPNVIHLTSNDTDSPVRDETAEVIAFPALKNESEVDAK